MNDSIDIQEQAAAEPAASERWLRRVARFLLPLITAIMTVQPMAYAAPSPSLLMQEPRFLDITVEPNVIFMMDDSDSMNDTRLPVPTGLNPQESVPGQVTIGGWVTGIDGSGNYVVDAANTNNRLNRERANDWIHRAHVLNPLYYNPEVHYRPWNDNRRIEISQTNASVINTFPDASTAINRLANNFPEGLVRQDQRYRGANYTSTQSTDRSPISTTTGANPPSSAPFVAPARPDYQGFQGVTDPVGCVPGSAGCRNQDIFSSPLVYVTNVQQQCLAGAIAMPSTPLGTILPAQSARPSFAITTSARPSSAVTYENRNYTDTVYEARNSYTIQTETRNSQAINYQPRNSTAYSTAPRPSTAVAYEARPYSARTSTAQPMEYRQETGECGVWGPWQPTMPAPAFCSSSSEGDRLALIQSQYAACPAGTTLGGGNTCLSNCAAGTTAGLNGAQQVCWSNTCTTGTYVVDGALSGATQCRSPCGGDVIGGQCYTACTGATTQMIGASNVATQCQTPCAGNIISGQCYTTCPASATVMDGAPTVATQCHNCSAGQIIAGLCYTTCPTAGWTPSGTQCVQPCTGTASAGTCYTSCPTTGNIVNPGNVAQCQTPCTGGNQIGTRCYLNCPTAGYTFVGAAAAATQCQSPCAGGNVIGASCYTACPAGTSAVGALTAATTCQTACSGTNTYQSGSTCYTDCAPNTLPTTTSTVCVAACPAAYPRVHPNDPLQCIENCPSGSTLTLNGTACQACPVNYTMFGGSCCPDANLVNVGTGCPANQTCNTANQWYTDPNQSALAHYFVFNPSPAIASPTAADLANPANYVLVEINRDRQFSYPKAAGRDDCAGSTCTWAEEAQNFANWYTYYRTRLFTAISVTAQSLSSLTNGRDQIRLGYGSINYFPQGRDPYGGAGARLPGSLTLDGQSSPGHIVRGVRFFTEINPPPAPGSDDRRQEVFDWLFSLRGIGQTPNREALDAVGRYFQRTDTQGPWIQPSSGSSWSSSEAAADHISCRRNYTIFITDGEWTRANASNPPSQPLVEQRGTQLDALMSMGSTYTGPTSATPYTYDPATQPQFTTNGSAAGGTLTDIAVLYWSRDLRPDLQNNIKPTAPDAGSQGNPAFWQHLTPYLIGYGISASMDTAAVRSTVISSATTPTAINWPSVRLESRPAEIDTIITDRDTAVGPTDIDCGYNPATNPSGCGRVNDTMRAALAARGNFLSAANVGQLSAGIANAFSAISEIEASATSVGGRSATFQAGDRIFLASFKTGRWTGRIDSFDAMAWSTAAINGTPEPTAAPDRVPSWFPAAASRNIITSTDVQAPIAFPTGAADFNTLSAAQQTELLNDPTIVRWLRGDQTTEVQNGGAFRTRPTGEYMADIVNSTPLFSKATDFGYSSSRRPAGDTSGNANAYRQFVTDNQSYRPATIFAGANGGMLHAFDASGSPVATLPGPIANPAYNANYMQEKFAYVPRATYPQLKELTAPGYVHRYYVDGQVVEGDVYMAGRGGWRTAIVTTSGAGPKSIFAIDATMRNGATPAALQPSDVLFDIDVANSTDPNAQYVGNIMGPGIIASVPTETGRWFYLVGNGFESTSDKARLLAIDMSSGAITAIGPSSNDDGGNNPTAAARAGRPNGLGAITPVFDANRNVTAVYAGDRLGHLWKFDLSSGLGSATVTLMFDTADNPATTLDSQSITAAPRFTPHPLGGRIIVFGTGRFTERDDPSDASVQSVYAIREENVSAPTRVTWTGAKSIYTGLSLSEQVVGAAPNQRRFRVLNGTAGLDWALHSGWYYNLAVGGNFTGERVIVTPIENFGFMNITSYEPVAGGDRCMGGGASFFYRLDIAGSFTRDPFSNVGAVASLPGNIARNTVIGADMPAMMGAPTLMTGGSPTTSTAGTSLTSSELINLPRQRATATDPCSTIRALGRSTLNSPVAGLPITCAIPPLRVWRDLPRGPR